VFRCHVWGHAYAFLTSALHESEWVVNLTPRERASGSYWIPNWVGPRADLDMGVKKKMVLLGTEPVYKLMFSRRWGFWWCSFGLRRCVVWLTEAKVSEKCAVSTPAVQPTHIWDIFNLTTIQRLGSILVPYFEVRNNAVVPQWRVTNHEYLCPLKEAGNVIWYYSKLPSKNCPLYQRNARQNFRLLCILYEIF
jgi:hypothetical protein